MIDRSTGRSLILVLAVLVGLLAMPVGAATQSTSRFPGNPTLGQQLFSERGCVRCHSIWGTGGELGPDLGEVGLGRSLMQLAGMFWNHTPRMIETVRSQGLEWPIFAESDLADVISFIYYVKLFDPPGNPELGAQWFSQKRCTECHSVGSNGGTAAAPLDSYARFIAPLPLAAGMWNHGKAMRGLQAAKGVPVPQFYGGELADIQAFIREASALRNRNIDLLPPPDLARGERLFSSKGCTACHGTTGRGTARAPDLSAAIQQLRVSEIAGVLWNHSARITEAMEQSGITFPEFEGSELADVIAYLYYLRYEEMEGDVRAGRALFAAKGCSSCHFLDGAPSIGPDLTRSAVVSTPVSLTTAMWNHAPAMYSRVRQARMPWPLFQGNEMRDLAAFLSTLSAGER